MEDTHHQLECCSHAHQPLAWGVVAWGRRGVCSGRVPTRVRGQINIRIPVAPVRCSSVSPRTPPAAQGMVYNSGGLRGGMDMIATQRAVRGPRPASPCTHPRGAPAATLANHHVANGVENRRWGDRRRTGVPRAKSEAAEDAAKYTTQNKGQGTLWGWRAGAAGPQGQRTTPLLPKPHTCACDASSRKRSGAGNARGLPRCRAPVNVDGGPHQR